MTQATEVQIRAATHADLPLLLELIGELADYEKLRQEVSATEAGLRKALFGEQPVAEAAVARYAGSDAGFALYFHNFSTFLTKPGIYLEDLFVRPEFRGRGIGKALLVHVARLAVERGCGRFEWAVLDWNRPALDFYAALGAQSKTQWIIHRLSDAALLRLAGS
jgi:GNAT superfamily N-acetyltransferase